MNNFLLRHACILKECPSYVNFCCLIDFSRFLYILLVLIWSVGASGSAYTLTLRALRFNVLLLLLWVIIIMY